MQEPYWKQRTKSAPDGAETAKLRRQLAEISKDFSGLLGLQQKSDAQLADLQGKIKLLRQELATKDKQLDLCRRTIDRLTDERAQHEARQRLIVVGCYVCLGSLLRGRKFHKAF